MKNNTQLIAAFLPFLLTISLISADSHFDSFAKCLTKNGVPTNQVSKILYSPQNPSFTSVLDAYVRNKRFNTSTTKKPTIIVTPLTVPQAQAAVLCTKVSKLQLKIRSGGHDYEGISYVAKNNFVILDLFNLRSISIDVGTKTTWVQAGATLGELFYRIWEKSNVLGFPAGVCPTVGVGGHLSGGGYGTMLRKYGLSVDQVTDAQIIDVKGKVLDRKSMGEDLFWAIRGGGGASFGVVLSYKVNLVPVPAITTVFSVQRFDNLENILVKWQNMAPKTDNNLFIRALVQPATRSGQRVPRLTFNAMYLGDANSLLTIMSSQFPELALNKTDLIEMSWIRSVMFWTNFRNSSTPESILLDRVSAINFLKRKSDYVQTVIPKAGLTAIFGKIIQGKVGLVFNPYGGRMDEIAPEATPFPHRKGNLYKIQYSVNWDEPDTNLTTQYLREARELYSFMTPYVSSNPRQAFLNYRDLDIGTTSNGKKSYSEGKVYGEKYFVGNFDRLVKVKTAVDPTNFFRNEQSIPTLPY